jgi:catechol 2,3-dioxygenase-like lactoylglutathione lyase family enzyme
MIDHVSVGVVSLARSAAFYDAVLAPLGYVRLWSTERGVGYGPPHAKDEPFAIFEQVDAARPAGAGAHLAFRALSRAAVDAFHSAGLLACGTDAGPPGSRPKYGEGYYAAFLKDPDGHKLEAVCHELLPPSG